MDISLQAPVLCTDGLAGQSVAGIISRSRYQLTHLVMELEGFQTSVRFIPVRLVQEGTLHFIQLRCTLREMSVQTQSTVTEDTSQEVAPFPLTSEDYLLWPYYSLKPPRHSLCYEAPPGQLTITQNESVEATDGRVGQVESLRVNSSSKILSHLVLRTGYLWWQRHIGVPVTQIDHIGKSRVYLKLTKKAVRNLSDAEILKMGQRAAGPRD